MKYKGHTHASYVVRIHVRTYTHKYIYVYHDGESVLVVVVVVWGDVGDIYLGPVSNRSVFMRVLQ
jgi:hypothetical protein